MSDYIENMKSYWNKRFEKEDCVWGKEASETAYYALDLFNEREIKDILVPGAGYGRNARLFFRNDYNVVGIEISDIAFDIAKEFAPETKFHHGNVLDIPYDDKVYDAIYCYSVLHLFRKKERELFLNKCFNKLREGGFIFFAAASDKEDSFGKGREVEPNTFESRPGRPVHYYSEEDMKNEFKRFKLIETGVMEDEEDHGEGPHVHISRYIFARKWVNGD